MLGISNSHFRICALNLVKNDRNERDSIAIIFYVGKPTFFVSKPSYPPDNVPSMNPFALLPIE